MTTRDEDILDFGFDDELEPAWEEPGGQRPAPPPRAPRARAGPPRLRPPRNLTPLLRLVALVALAILIVVLLAVWVEGCTAEAKRERYGDYLAEAGSIGTASARLGRQLETLLTTPGLKQEDLDAKLRGFVQTAEGHVQQASALDPPGPLLAANDAAVLALEYRVNGLRGLQATFQQTAGSDAPAEAGRRLSAQVQRLLASDVIWADSFRGQAQAVLEQEGVTGLDVPASEFVASDDLATPSALAAIWQRVQGASTGGAVTGLHGNAIAYVRALPSGQLLSTTTETTILVTDDLAFEVGVEDTGDYQEVQVKVRLTILKQPEPIVRTGTIPIIDPGETKSVTLRVGALVPFGETVAVKVEVEPVPGETRTQNNTAEYPVIFSLA